MRQFVSVLGLVIIASAACTAADEDPLSIVDHVELEYLSERFTAYNRTLSEVGALGRSPCLVEKLETLLDLASGSVVPPTVVWLSAARDEEVGSQYRARLRETAADSWRRVLDRCWGESWGKSLLDPAIPFAQMQRAMESERAIEQLKRAIDDPATRDNILEGMMRWLPPQPALLDRVAELAFDGDTWAIDVLERWAEHGKTADEPE